ncbi:MAG: MBL fold metallo-hydrolase [Chloroflexi bacterium]|nr:MBL fold metallo-hydrolase [Chloroflexota bacterium]
MPRRNVPRRWQTGLIEVGAGAYAYVQGGGTTGVSNGGLILGDEAAAAVDSLMLPRMTRAFRRAIRRASRLPVRHLINTHHHVDHIGGNQFFKSAEIIAHANCRDEMLRTGIPLERIRRLMPRFAEEMRGLTVVPPAVTFQDSLTLHLGDRAIELLYLGPAHTPGDALVYLPREKVLFAGDVAFHYVVPGPFDAHVSGWIRVCDRIAEMDVEVVVPGHGPVGDKALLREMRDYLALVRRQARRFYEQEMPAEEAARQLKVGGYYAQWANPERLPLLVQRLYMELRGEI